MLISLFSMVRVNYVVQLMCDRSLHIRHLFPLVINQKLGCDNLISFTLAIPQRPFIPWFQNSRNITVRISDVSLMAVRWGGMFPFVHSTIIVRYCFVLFLKKSLSFFQHPYSFVSMLYSVTVFIAFDAQLSQVWHGGPSAWLVCLFAPSSSFQEPFMLSMGTEHSRLSGLGELPGIEPRPHAC